MILLIDFCPKNEKIYYPKLKLNTTQRPTKNKFDERR